MFTEEEIQFLKQLWEECGEGLGWEPQFGDWVLRLPFDNIAILVKYSGVTRVGHIFNEDGSQEFVCKEELVPLFTEGQLIRMLEERGYYPGVQKCRKPDEWWAGAALRAWNEWPHDTDVTIQGLGPTPIIALGRCLIEVAKSE